MFYVIRNGNRYFSSGGTYVNSSGLCAGACWVLDRDLSFGTSSLEEARLIADRYGGQPEPYQLH